MSLPPFPGFGPLTRVTPFTHRDNATFLRILQEMINYLNGPVTDYLNSEVQSFLDQFNDKIGEFHDEINTFETNTNTAIADFTSATNTAIAAFEASTTTTVNNALTDIETTKTSWQNSFDTFMANVTANIAALNDAGMATNINNGTSQTSVALNAARKRVPAYIGQPTRNKSFNRSLCLYNGESPTLRTIRNLVKNGLAGTRTRIVAAGDSKTFGNGSPQPQVSTNSYPAQLAERLNAMPGLIYGNLGDTRWSAPSNVVSAVATNNNYLTCTGTWSVTFTSLVPFTSFKAFAYISPGGNISVTVDGVAQTAFNVIAGSTWKVATYSGFANTTHTIVFSGTVDTTFLGIVPVFTTGITISNAGRPSSSAAEWLSITDWSRLYSSAFSVNNANLTAEKPDLALINIGTNTNTSTLDDITSFITNVKNLSIPILLLGFGGVGTAGAYDNKRVRMYDIADSLDLPLLDFTELIGDSAAASALGLMAVDGVHENDRGYALEADAIIRVIKD